MLLVAILAIVLAALFSRGTAPAPVETTAANSAPTADPTTPVRGDVVDTSVVDKGWVPEPITTDAETYVRAALEAASTFDTQLSTRAEWLTYLDTWFTPDTRYTSEDDRASDMQTSQLELRQGVVLPEAEWDSLANEDGRVTAVAGEVEFTDVPNDASGGMSIGAADVVLTYTRSDGSGGDATSYDETVRVSVQVLCGAGSVPAPGTAQQEGDCKVVRYFSGSLEP
ncbi:MULTISPECIES: hypothetical protein [Microbacterium]|uniref:Uncharacterized protein n=1 Tax=Microbacterium wangchenii TaxID=2541726 RepID=A0ABX5SYZ3_9MICO|nr:MULTISPECIES: hypothetical protein [Microbacterium]MCK6065747.1 hypothetical protein [Microbacterium sp. EYE_512]QBR90064.1 hypothetical protein E4K62_16075 [Microbacterium wangchenii]